MWLFDLFKKKKEEYVPLVGIMGVGEDYNVYFLSPIEKIIGFVQCLI